LNDTWVLEHRGPKARLDPFRAYATAWEEEPDASGVLVSTAVIFLTNRECPFRCVMCDLWVNTLDVTVPEGAIAGQIRAALADPEPALANATAGSPGVAGIATRRPSQIKLYNAGSFFDPRAIPPSDDEEIAGTVTGFGRVIVEAHPAFLAGAHGQRCLRFRDLLSGRLEVAIGLETAHPETLARLNKRMTVDSFRRAAGFLARHDIDLRVFLLLNPPFLPPPDAVEWTCRSLDMAMECGASAVSIIPTRSGNGAIEALGDSFQPPRLPALEEVIAYGLSLHRGRVFADLWDIARVFDCACSPARAARLHAMNRSQKVEAPVHCSCQTSRGAAETPIARSN
jgi:archaeosine synthase beta-subunit